MICKLRRPTEQNREKRYSWNQAQAPHRRGPVARYIKSLLRRYIVQKLRRTFYACGNIMLKAIFSSIRKDLDKYIIWNPQHFSQLFDLSIAQVRLHQHLHLHNSTRNRHRCMISKTYELVLLSNCSLRYTSWLIPYLLLFLFSCFMALFYSSSLNILMNTRSPPLQIPHYRWESYQSFDVSKCILSELNYGTSYQSSSQL